MVLIVSMVIQYIQHFTTVKIFSQFLHQSGSDPSDEAFREFLLILRDSDIQHNDWQILLKHSSVHSEDNEILADAAHLF